MIRHPGSCKVCGEPTREIIRQLPAGHPFAGRPTKIGKHLPGILRATLLLTNGNHCDLEVHTQCVSKLREGSTLAAVWGDILETTAFEFVNRVALGAAPLTREQSTKQWRDIEALADIRPIGILSEGETK